MSEPKRFKYDYTSLEQLPNELFIDIFDHLSGVDTVYAFSQLNNRFQSLLDEYVNKFDFKSVRKVKFDFVTQNHDIHRWESLRLSDDDETPGQIKLFCQLFPPAEYISQLQSLSLVNMQPKLAQEVFSHLGSFDHLVSLTIGKIDGKDIQPVELPSLKRLVVTSCNHTNWMKNLHCLESMEYTFDQYYHDDDVFILPTTLKQLKLFYEEGKDGNGVRSSLRPLSQLTKLSLYDIGRRSFLPDGGKWEQLIQSSLPLLTTFQFCFPFHCCRSPIHDINQAVASFSTPFYLIEKCWFIRCNSAARSSSKGILYSIPFAFTEMPVNTLSFDTSMSTLPVSDISETQSNSYATVKTLIFNEKCQVPIRDFLTSSIVKLVLNTSLPTNWLFLLTNLRYLECRHSLYATSTDFAHLLLITPQLQSLKLPIVVLKNLTNNFTNNAVCDLLSQRIRSLIITKYYSDGHGLGVVTVRQLSNIVRIFGNNLKHLSLALAAHPNTVQPILRRMRQLRSLHIRYDTWHRKSEGTATSWLQQPPIDTTVSDFMHVTDENDFYVWFGNSS